MRKHKGINQKTGKLKKGYKYSGKKLKNGLPAIVQTGGNSKKKVFRQKNKEEAKYKKCKNHSDCGRKMSYCCPNNSPIPGYCRKDVMGCYTKGINSRKRRGNLSPTKLKELRKNMGKNVKLPKELEKKIMEKALRKEMDYKIQLKFRELVKESLKK